jgi:hypothetical protein
MTKQKIWRDVNGIEKLPGSKDGGRRDYTEELPGKRDTPDYDEDEPADDQDTAFV